MKKLTFSRQLTLGMLIMAICLVIAFVAKIEVFQNIAWILYGLLFFINPVVPQNVPDGKIKIARIALLFIWV